MDHSSLTRLLTGQLDRIPRVDPQGLSDAIFLLVQNLYEKSEHLHATDWRRSERLKHQADRIIELHNAAFTLPSRRSLLDGPTELIKGRKK